MTQTEWNEMQVHVLRELERIAAKVDVLDEKVTDLRVAVAQKGAMWGAITGLASAVAIRVMT